MSFCENIWDSDQGETIKIQGGTIENIMHSADADYVKTVCRLQKDSRIQSVVVMIVDEHTLIHCSDGKRITSRDLKEGMTVDAWISKAMTKSIPSQARAYRIIVKSSPCGTAVTIRLYAWFSPEWVRTAPRGLFPLPGRSRSM